MKKGLFETILSFLLGISWALMFLGALFVFKLLWTYSLYVAIFGTIIFIFVFLFLILILEMMNLYRESYEDKKEQIKLLQNIYQQLKKDETF